MADEMMLMLNDDGVAHIYDETYDIVIHCESAEKQKEVEKKLLEMSWVPCSERLPDMYRAYYLVSLADKKEVDIAYFTEYGTWETFRNDEVEAWMPLPEPWEGMP